MPAPCPPDLDQLLREIRDLPAELQMQQVAEGRKASKTRRLPPLRTAAVEYLDGFGTCREFPPKPAWRHKVARVTFTASACGQRSCSAPASRSRTWRRSSWAPPSPGMARRNCNFCNSSLSTLQRRFTAAA